MKILLFLLLGLFSPCLSAFAEVTHKVEGNKIIAVSTKSSSSSKVEETPYTYVDTKGKEYKVYKSIKGKYFIKKVSTKGKEYNWYLPKEIIEKL